MRKFEITIKCWDTGNYTTHIIQATGWTDAAYQGLDTADLHNARLHNIQEIGR
jgi:hypothetical protein